MTANEPNGPQLEEKPANERIRVLRIEEEEPLS